MLVDFSHRAETKAYSADVYESLATRLCNQLASLSAIDAVVVCGSLIKDTLVAGWSDLDIIAFFGDQVSRHETLKEVRSQIQSARGDILIGIGVDIVFSEDFRRSTRLGGRPLAMTFEVAGYGRLYAGTDPFVNLLATPQILERIEFDKVQSIRAELHNWRRAYIREQADNPISADWLARCVKTSLKLLKYETDPNLCGPYTYDAALLRAKTSPSVPSDIFNAFRAAVTARKEWSTLIENVEASNSVASHLMLALSSYPDPEAR